jgi:hypothetical protein
MTDINSNRSFRFLSTLANIVLISALLPFVSPFPTLFGMITDIQPTATIVATIVLFLLVVLAPKSLTITPTDVLLFLAGIFSLIYFDWFNTEFNLEWIRRTGHILFGFPVCYAVRNLYRHMSPWTFVFVVAFYFVVTVIEIVAPSLYFGIASAILSNVRSAPGFGRVGKAGLTLEPSHLAILSGFFIIVPLIFKRCFWKKHRRAYWFVVLASSFMLIISWCGTAVLIIGALLFIWFFFIRKGRMLRKFILLIGLLLLYIVARGIETHSFESRFANVGLNILRNPLNILYDPSAAMRLTTLYVGVFNLLEVPFGTLSIYTDYSLVAKAFDNPIIEWMVGYEAKEVAYAYAMGILEIPQTGFKGGGISPLAQSIQRMGIFYVVFLVFLFTLIKGHKEAILFRVLFFIFILNSSLAMSVTWFMLGLFVASNKQRFGIQNG